jgi:WD40 repeat protein
VILRDGIIISTHRQLTSQSVKLTVKRWDIEDGTLLGTFEYQESDRKQFFDKYEISPDGLHVLTIHYDKKARIRDLRTGECIGVMQAREARFVSDQIVFCIGKDKILWNFKTNEKMKKGDEKPVIEEEKPVVCIRDVPVKESDKLLYLDIDSMRLWTADWRGEVKLWDIKSGRCLRTDYNEKTKYLMDETHHRMIKWKKPLYDDWFEWCPAELPEAGTPAQWQLSRITSVAERLSLEDRVLALGSQFRERIENDDIAAALRLHDEMRQIKGFENSEYFRRQNRSLNRYCSKNTLHMMEHAWTYKLEGSRITALKLSRDGDHLYAGSSAEDIKRIDPESGACTAEFKTELGGATSLELVGSTICAGTYGGHVERYDLRTGTRIDTPIPFDENEFYPDIIDINRNGKRALSNRNGRISVINAEDDREMSRYQKDRASKAIFCPDGWDVLTYKNSNGQLEYLEKSVLFEKVTDTDISAACISDDGRYAVSGGLEDIFLWDMETGKQKARLKSYQLYQQPYAQCRRKIPGGMRKPWIGKGRNV